MFITKKSKLAKVNNRSYKWFKFPNFYYCGGLTWLLFYDDYGYSNKPLACVMLIRLRAFYVHYLIISDVRYDRVDNVGDNKDIVTLVGFAEYINSLNLLFLLFIGLGFIYSMAVTSEYLYELINPHLYLFRRILEEVISNVGIRR